MQQVLIDMHRLRHNPYNGLYNFSMNLGRALAEAEHEGMHWNYYVPRKNIGIFGDAQSYVTHHSLDKFYRFRTGQFDLWHITTQLSWYRPFNRRTKLVYTLHDFSYMIEDAGNHERNRRLLKQTQRRVDRADHVTAISQFALNQAHQYLDMRGVSTSVIYNGCEMHGFPGFDAPSYRPGNAFLFSIGLVQPRKNFHVLPALLVGNGKELVIAGLNEFGYGEEVMAAARKMGVADRVKMIGPVSEEEKYWYYRHCEAFVFPSYAEGFGLPVVEAMYHEKPVFISDKTSLPEVGGTAAYYFNDFSPEHMRAVYEQGMNDYSLPGRKQKIREQALTFNWHKSAVAYIDVYRKLLFK